MEERRWDEDTKLTDGPLSPEAITAALHDPVNRFVAMHKPGSFIARSPGLEFLPIESFPYLNLVVDSGEVVLHLFVNGTS